MGCARAPQMQAASGALPGGSHPFFCTRATRSAGRWSFGSVARRRSSAGRRPAAASASARAL
eukprot:4202057-Prymnesium_polylepis.1